MSLMNFPNDEGTEGTAIPFTRSQCQRVEFSTAAWWPM
jgi:hypothetical protein